MAVRVEHVLRPELCGSDVRGEVPRGVEGGGGRSDSRGMRERRTFLDFLMVTRETPCTCFMPSFCIALRDFFSLRLCLPLADPSSAAAPAQGPQHSCRKRSN